MAAVRARTVLLTGSNRGIGLELVKQLLGAPRPPAWIFATCRDPEGPRAQVSPGEAGGGGSGAPMGAGRCHDLRARFASPM